MTRRKIGYPTGAKPPTRVNVSKKKQNATSEQSDRQNARIKIKKNEIVIPLPLLTLNEYTDKQRAHWSVGSKAHKEQVTKCYVACVRAKQAGVAIETPCFLNFKWYTKTNHDPDNIAFQKKFILDGMVRAGLIKDDSKKQIKGFCDHFFESENEMVVVETRRV